MSRGKFICIEGMDGAGTTTQTKLLAQWLETLNIEAVHTFEPTDDLIGWFIRRILKGEGDKEALPWLFAADRALHATQIRHHLEQGRWVITDRYVMSSLAYQTLGHHSFEDIWKLNDAFLIPDLTVVLVLPVQEAIRRIDDRGSDKDIFEKKETLERIHIQYTLAYTFLSNRRHCIHRVSGDEITEQVAQNIHDLVKSTLKPQRLT